MAVNPFATNYLVADHDMYKEFMDKRFEYMKNNNITTDVLFCNGNKKGVCFIPTGKISANDTSSYTAIIKWHCITISYSIWCDLVKDYVKEDNRVANYKKFVNVPVDVLKKFKYRVERSIENARCDYNKRLNGGHGGNLNACRYLVMFWTYLDLKRDCKTQRYFPDLETIQRAAMVFGYADKENPFEMNGRFTKRANRKVSEEKPMEQTEQNVDIRSIKIEDLELSMRTYNALKLARINTLGDILDKTYDNLSKVRNLGLHSLREIEAKLNEYGYGFSGDGVIRPNIAPKESVIDIAEEAAKKVEEEEKLNSVEMVHPYDYNALLEKYNKLKDCYDGLDADRDKLLNRNHDLMKEIENLENNMEELKSREMKLNIAANPKNLDTLALLNTVLEKMKESKMEYILLTIDGMVIDIHPKQNFTIKTREAGYGRV